MDQTSKKGGGGGAIAHVSFPYEADILYQAAELDDRKNGSYTRRKIFFIAMVVLFVYFAYRVILDMSGEEKNHLTIEELLHKFEEVSGSKFTSDSVILG